MLELQLTHWGRVTHICFGKLAIIGSDNGLSPERRQAIIWTNAGILLIGPLGTNFNEILIEIQTFSLKKICLKMSSVKCCSFRLGLNVLNHDNKRGPGVLTLGQPYSCSRVSHATTLAYGKIDHSSPRGVFCGSSIRLIFCLSSCNYLCNIFQFWTGYNVTHCMCVYRQVSNINRT